ncbi:MAG: YqcI/YcgG family protein [Steroidobacteraceae bacterium]|jgi:hypothetical protein|nr:YqcI/YcgG family protein [Steroidobacteraceae bacterium]
MSPPGTSLAPRPSNPLAAVDAIARHSRLLRVQGRCVIEPACDGQAGGAGEHDLAALAALLPGFVFDTGHPCVMARSALQRGAVRIGTHRGFGGLAAAVSCHDLYECLAETRADQGAFVSYAALFPGTCFAGEAEFEDALWQHLQAMHEVDRRYFGWDPSVSPDPDAARFSFSVGGHAWYVIGMHPLASRLARRAPAPLLVFNPHAQFEQLRAAGSYRPLRDRIRARDRALQGSVNPMLADHGSASEARQYSGRAVEPSWRCPFQPGRAAAAAPDR